MLAEIANALFVTYVATEYGTTPFSFPSSKYRTNRFSCADDETDSTQPHHHHRRRRPTQTQQLQRIVAIGICVVLVNICDEIVGLGLLYHTLANVFVILHIPKAVIVVPSAYLTALYCDCRASVARLSQPQRTTATTSTSTTTGFSGVGGGAAAHHHHRRRGQETALSVRDFIPRVARLFIRILPIYPIGAVLISFGFMFLIALFDALHLPETLLNWPVYYGTLYGPFSYIYYVTKRDVIRECTVAAAVGGGGNGVNTVLPLVVSSHGSTGSFG